MQLTAVLAGTVPLGLQVVMVGADGRTATKHAEQNIGNNNNNKTKMMMSGLLLFILQFYFATLTHKLHHFVCVCVGGGGVFTVPVQPS